MALDDSERMGGLDLLVENRYTTQGTTVPLGLVFGEIGKH
jgi:hypothetical protein